MLLVFTVETDYVVCEVCAEVKQAAVSLNITIKHDKI